MKHLFRIVVFALTVIAGIVWQFDIPKRDELENLWEDLEL